MLRRFNGSNNGRIGMGVRAAATAVNVDPGTVSGYFHILEAAGFIGATRRSGFNLKAPGDRLATEWALTWLSVEGQPPTKDFMVPGPSNFHGVENPHAKCGKPTLGPKRSCSLPYHKYGKPTLVTPIRAVS